MKGQSTQIVVGVGDARVSANRVDCLITYSLGSCIGVALYDPRVAVGGMLHYQLPFSTADSARAREKPMMFADTGMALLMAQMEQLGASPRRLRVHVAGAAEMLNDRSFFDIGRRNHAAIRRILWQQGLFLHSEHIGGNLPRTMSLNIADGAVAIKQGQNLIAL